MEMTGARIVIETSIEQGVDTVFGYPGGTILNVYDELFKCSDRIRHILTAHEQGAAHAADGYARSTGRPGVVMATSGPGATNLVTGIATAYMDSVPLVAITCNVPNKLLGKDSFQEVDIAGITMPITKHNYIVKDVAALADTSGRPSRSRRRAGGARSSSTSRRTSPRPRPSGGPAASAADAGPATGLRSDPRFRAKRAPVVSDARARRGGRLIAASRAPFVYAGGGVIASDASEELRALVERLKAPVALSLMGHGAFPSRHPLFTGMIGMHGTKASNMASSRADLLIAIGARFSDRVVSDVSRFAAKAKHPPYRHRRRGDQQERPQLHVPRRRREGRPRAASLARRPSGKNRTGTATSTRGRPRCPPPTGATPTSIPRFILEEIHARVGDDAIVTTEVGQHQMWTAQFYPFAKPRTFISSGGLGTMGFGTGAAMGAQVANPDRQVVHIAGRRLLQDELRRARDDLALRPAHPHRRDEQRHPRHGAAMAEHVLQGALLADDPGQAAGFRQARRGLRGQGLPRQERGGVPRGPRRGPLASGSPALVECILDIDEKVLPMVPSGKPIDELILEPPEE